MHCFSKKISKNRQALHPQCPLTFNIGNLKLRDLAKLWIFKLIMEKLNFKKNQL